jgi:hypothetical protein
VAVQLPDRPCSCQRATSAPHSTSIVIIVVFLLVLLRFALGHRIAAQPARSAMTEASSPSASLAALPPSQEPGLSSPQSGPVRSSSENVPSDVAAPNNDPARERIETILQSEVRVFGVLCVLRVLATDFFLHRLASAPS